MKYTGTEMTEKDLALEKSVKAYRLHKEKMEKLVSEGMDFIFTLWSLDEVAECMKVSNDLYRKLWSLITPDAPQDTGDNFSDRCLGRHWEEFTDAEKAELNTAAKKINDEYGIKD